MLRRTPSGEGWNWPERVGDLETSGGFDAYLLGDRGFIEAQLITIGNGGIVGMATEPNDGVEFVQPTCLLTIEMG